MTPELSAVPAVDEAGVPPVVPMTRAQQLQRLERLAFAEIAALREYERLGGVQQGWLETSIDWDLAAR